MKPTDNNNMERHIVEVARQVFIEKGFVEASMSDIALRAGINRPVLHYYFRTKDRMFEAVFADIVCSFLPTIHQIVLQDKPVAVRVAEIVEIYFDVMQHTPLLPVFAVREVQRDAAHLYRTILKMETGQYIRQIKEVLQAEIACGRIRQIPIEFVFYTFYGLLFAPFLSRPLTDLVFGTSAEGFPDLLAKWKEQVINQIVLLLEA